MTTVLNSNDYLEILTWASGPERGFAISLASCIESTPGPRGAIEAYSRKRVKKAIENAFANGWMQNVASANGFDIKDLGTWVCNKTPDNTSCHCAPRISNEGLTAVHHYSIRRQHKPEGYFDMAGEWHSIQADDYAPEIAFGYVIDLKNPKSIPPRLRFCDKCARTRATLIDVTGSEWCVYCDSPINSRTDATSGYKGTTGTFI